MKAKKTVIELRDVWKTYQLGAHQVNALRGLNLKVYEGEFVAIQGPSGSGKSTAMHLVGCLDVPSKGAIFLDSQNIAEMSESDLATVRGKKIGFIFQKFNLLPTLNALQNVALPLIFQGIPEQERQETAENLLKLVGLGERMNHKPNELSGGEQQRVAIARALAVNPEVILADEPTGNLDSKTGEEVMDFLRKLNTKHGKTIIFVTHDDELAKEADRIEYLKDGQIVKSTKGKHSEKHAGQKQRRE